MLSKELLSLASILVSVLATCYFPDGNVSYADVACNPSASDSACCYHDQACLSNGLCQTGDVNGVLQYARGTCTDPNWESSACPRFCLDQQGLGNVMYSCNITGQDEYCCNDNCGCTQNGINQVVSFTGTPYTLTVISETGTYPDPSATPSSSSSPSSSSATPTSGAGSSSISSAAASATSTTVSPSSSSSSGSGASATAIGVGVGVGVGGALLLLGAGAFFIYRRRQRANRGRSQLSDKHGSVPPAYSHDNSYLLETPKPGQTDHSLTLPSIPSELGASNPHTRSELPGTIQPRAELPT